ncbi:hypothetical protein JEG43_00215 [Anoxybacillus sp. LAT_35]|uniref:hypothetical protein n=1 Tax=unclassified Anoxybacillus TaxID=2639704 RepID=UPI001EDACA20|nr:MULTISPECIES: hypothetical protein [unclassified Anoxybacillus]MCG5024641.1 hypothetical protein [Anoxybacillus flavithermus]MCG6198043.1 hypothetical protein [Anoxybacillus sp. LAT_38]MCG3085906.1 hypothetical protein [Anoxybacillus sp. LAT27]MCG6172701.1 hypothetical protein [Anoxybacillus sp. LAT_11]MCG6173337.1 hypothetical protein [Anoxybacillus sp. LAT_11]
MRKRHKKKAASAATLTARHRKNILTENITRFAIFFHIRLSFGEPRNSKKGGVFNEKSKDK